MSRGEGKRKVLTGPPRLPRQGRDDWDAARTRQRAEADGEASAEPGEKEQAGHTLRPR